MAKQRKTMYVIDTNVILHDPDCLKGFGNNDIGIPITVLEEIDDFKKGKDQLNYNSRSFTRIIDQLTSDLEKGNRKIKDSLESGIRLFNKTNKLFFLTDVNYKDEFKDKFFGEKEDHRILAAAYNYKINHPDVKTIFVTKDVNLRIKARALGILAEDYNAGKIKDMQKTHSDHIEIKNVDQNVIQKLLSDGKIPLDFIKNRIENQPDPNEFFILKNENAEVKCRYEHTKNVLKMIYSDKVYGISPRNPEQCFALDLLLDDKINLVTITGSAGTGKTLIALASSLQRSVSYNQIILSRPIVPLSNKDIGYLPGTAKNKIEPYMQPLYDNLSFIQNQFKETDENYTYIEELQKREKLIISPLAYIRGRTLSKVYFIIDEAQNLTPHEVKTIITRAGEGTKIVFTGDLYQIDTPFLDAESNGLAYIIDKLKGEKLYGHVNLQKGVRSTLSELASKLL
ncbi:MAG: PhoH family protein [Candidatus Delongbacteria bacterium]|nr:PhoH family protein [Candidatus Delongbacteria bacterium]MBN2834360.1 PhoH family protein [Candidatus Delongbacteria bacterium]